MLLFLFSIFYFPFSIRYSLFALRVRRCRCIFLNLLGSLCKYLRFDFLHSLRMLGSKCVLSRLLIEFYLLCVIPMLLSFKIRVLQAVCPAMNLA